MDVEARIRRSRGLYGLLTRPEQQLHRSARHNRVGVALRLRRRDTWSAASSTTTADCRMQPAEPRCGDEQRHGHVCWDGTPTQTMVPSTCAPACAPEMVDYWSRCGKTVSARLPDFIAQQLQEFIDLCRRVRTANDGH